MAEHFELGDGSAQVLAQQLRRRVSDGLEPCEAWARASHYYLTRDAA